MQGAEWTQSLSWSWMRFSTRGHFLPYNFLYGHRNVQYPLPFEYCHSKFRENTLQYLGTLLSRLAQPTCAERIKRTHAHTRTHTHTPTNPSYPLFPFCGLTLKFTVVSVVDESELVVPSLSSDPKNVERLLERPSYQDYQRLGLGNLSSVGQRSRTEPFRLTTVNSTYSVCRRWEHCDCFCFLRTCFSAQVCYISPTVMNPCFSAQVCYISLQL